MPGPKIEVDIGTHLNLAENAANAAKLRAQFERVGNNIGGDLGRNIGQWAQRSSGLIVPAFDKMAAASQKVATSHRVHESSLRGLGNQMRRTENDVKSLHSRMKKLQDLDLGHWASRNLGALTPLGVVTPTLVMPLGAAFDMVASTAAAAAQSIWLLPAAIGAAAAGFGTLKLATAGLGNVLQDLGKGDLEKFAKDIQNLPPAAQQVALAIQQLEPAIKHLRDVTSEAFFAGIPKMLTNLARQYAPAIEGLTTGIASAFNKVMTDVGNLLMTPQMQGAVNELVTNIVAAFRELSPAITPMVQAFVELSRVGSSFLPEMVRDLAGLARNFRDFIDQASESGKLSQWMRQGYDAIKVVGEVLWDLGKTIYNVFAPAGTNIQDFKKQMFELNDVIGVFLTTLKTLFDDVVAVFHAIGPLAEHLGGLAPILARLAELWLGWKLWAGVIAPIGSALGGLVIKLAAVETGAEAASVAVAGMGSASVLSSIGALAGALGPVAAAVAVIAAGAGIGWFAASQLTPSAKDLARFQGVPGTPGVPVNPSNLPVVPGAVPPGPGTGGTPTLEDMLTGRAPAPAAPGPPAPWRPHDWTGKPIPGYPQGGWPVPPPPAGPGTGATGPQAPYPPEYGMMLPGERPEDFKRRMAMMDAEHQLAQDRLDLQTLEGQANHTEDDIVKQKNKILRDRIAADEAEQAYNQGRIQQNVIPFPPGYGQPPRPGETQQQYDEEQRLYAAQQKTAQALADYNAVMANSSHTTEQENDALNKLQDARRAEYSALLSLQEAGNKTSKTLDDVGAKLDADFGISKGLPGIAENIVKFLGNLAFAPVFGALKGADAALGGDTHGAKGLLGMLGLAAGPPQQGQAPGVPSLQGYQPGQYPGSQGQPGILSPGVGPGQQPGPANLPASRLLRDTGNVPSQAAPRTTAAILEQMFPGITQIGGSRPPGTSVPGTHDVGRTLDVSGPPEVLDQVRAYVEQNAQGLGVTSTIWRDLGRNLQNNRSGAAGTTFNQPGHQDHIDIQFADGATVSISPAGATISMPGSLGGSRGPGGMPTSGGPGRGSWNDWAYQQLVAAGLSPDQTRGILAMNTVEGGATNPQSLFGFTESQAQGPQGHLQAFLGQWNDPSRRGPGGTIPGIGPGGIVTDWPSYMTWIRERIVGQTGVQSDWQGNAQPPAAVYQQNLMNALPGVMDIGRPPVQVAGMQHGGGSTDTIPAMLTPGEHVLTVDDVNAMGGQRNVYAFRNALHRAAGGPMPQFALPPPPPPQPTSAHPPQVSAHPPSMYKPAPAPAPQGAPGPGVGAPPAIPALPSPGPMIGPPPTPGPPIGTPPGAGPTTIGGITAPAGIGGGFGITGGGLIGLLESLPATAIQYGISAAMAAAASAHHGGGVVRRQHGGVVGMRRGGAVVGMQGGGDTASALGGDVAGSLISAAIGIGMEELNRAISFAGQAAGILFGGLQETFLPAGVSQMAQESWATRIIGGIVGSRPALPNWAGGLAQQGLSLLQDQQGQQEHITPGPPLPTGAGEPGQTAEHGLTAGLPPGPTPGPLAPTGLPGAGTGPPPGPLTPEMVATAAARIAGPPGRTGGPPNVNLTYNNYNGNANAQVNDMTNLLTSSYARMPQTQRGTVRI